MFKATLKSLLAHKTRLALTALSIVLGVAFIAGTFIYTDTTNEAFTGIFDEAFVGIDVVVSGGGEFSFGQGTYFDEGMTDAIAAVDGVDVVEPAVDGFGVQVLDRDGEAIGGGGPPQLSGYLPTDVETAGGFTLRAGRAPAGPNEIVLDAATAETGEFTVGDIVPIVSQTMPQTEFELVGIVGFGEEDNLGGATFALFDLATAQTVLGQEGMITGAYVLAVPGADADDLATRIQQVLPENARAQTAQSAAEEQAADFQEALSFFNTFLLVFAFVALFVGSFIIYNTFQIVIAQRLRELALLRAIGSTRSQVIRTVLTEAAMVGLVSSVVGIVVGAGLAIGLRAAFEGFGIALPSTGLVLAPRTVVLGLAVGLIVTVVSALVPAVRASRIPPVAAMREEAARPRRRSFTIRAVSGGVLIAVGVILLLVGLIGDVDNTTAALSSVGAGALVIIMGAYVLSALVADPVSRIIGAPFARAQGVPGKLAQRNAGRSPRRTSATSAAIMVGIALISLVTILTASIQGTIDDVLTGGIDADVVATPRDQFSFTGFPTAFAEEAAALPEVDAVSRVQVGSVLIDGRETFVGTLDENASEIFAVDSLVGVFVPSATGVVVPESTAASNDLSIGTPLELTFEQTGPQEFNIEGIVDSIAVDSPVISREAYAANFAIDTDAQVYFRLVDGITPEEGRDAIAGVAANVPSVTVQTIDEQSDQLKDQINQVLALVTALLGLTVLISLFGVMNTMLLAVYERTREIGLLRAVGLDRPQTRRMVRSEASIIAVFGALLGVGLGIFFGWTVVKALEAEGFTAFVVPVVTLLVWIAITAILGVVFAMWPAYRASKLNVLEAIGYE